jgi:D-amino-acid dehydrogenase
MARHVVVISAGVTGVTTAYLLLRHGYQVIIIDAHRYPAMETSFANGGQLSAGNAEVWNRWSTIVKGLAWMLRRDAPLLVNPTPNWHKVSWMAEFVWNIRNYEANTIATTRLAIAARNELFAMAEHEHIDFDHERRGILHIYQTRRDYQHALQVNELLRKGGLERRAVSNEEIHGIRRRMGISSEDSSRRLTRQAIFTSSPEDLLARANGMVLDFDPTSQFRQSKTFRPEFGSASLALPQKERNGADDVVEADGVIICAGVESRKLTHGLGDRLNVYPVKGYSITVDLLNESSQAAAPWVSLLDDDAKIVTSRLGPNRLRVAGTAEFDDFNRDIRAARIRPLVDWTRRQFPEIDTDKILPWTGLRPMLPSMVPVVQASKRQRVFYNTGHGHLGWTLAAITARMAVNLVAQRL